VHHLRQRYGDAEVNTWLWEVWNEPDIEYWKGTHEEFFKLYDYSADAVLRAAPGAKIGGPEATGISDRSAPFLTEFLDHCDTGRNYATGKQGAPLGFISFHPKGSPKWMGDHVQMGISAQLKAAERGFKIVAASAKWRNTPIILSEWDPDSCGACSPQRDPRYGYRNLALYAVYTAEALDQTLALAERDHVKLQGIVTWAFEFEDQPYFAGFRELATNGLDKPVLNAFRMLGMMGNQRVEAISSGAMATEQVLSEGVRAQPEINALATRKAREIEVLVWNYHDDDLPADAAVIDPALIDPALIELTISGLPEGLTRGSQELLRIDSTHGNAFTAWKKLGSPQPPTADQYAQLESAGQLQRLDSPKSTRIDHGTAHLKFSLPRQGLSLLRIGW
jgi:xylan 1,4-beta-xylosidase